ncbi:glycosyltransferase family 4 protein [Candidatus Peregrinibacteria bacterium]|nr:glycosyltransferase family 4 protein [Candidatus Peregrinibacteria bacterium]
MRVCILTTVLDAYKGGNHLPLLSALPEVQFTILANRTKPEHHDLPENVRVEILHARIGQYYFGCADRLFALAVIRRHPPHHAFWKQFDVIHLNQTMGPALLALRKTGVPLCFFIHHPVSADLGIALQESSFLEGLFWRMKYFFLLRWQKRFCRTLPHVVTVSRTAAERIAADYGCDATRIHIVPNGVDTGQFVPNNDALSEFDVIAVGAFIHPRKGFRYLIDVYRRLSERGLKIADVGRRSAGQQKILRDIPNVRIFGTVRQEALVDLMRRSAVLISTSLYEGFGLSLIEALACGRPAFAFDAGAVGEVLSPIDPSLVVPIRDTAGLAARVIRFLQLPPAERAERGRGYRDAVTRLYPQKQSANRLRELYALLLAEKRQVR